MSKRTILCPAIGDPFLLNLWVNFSKARHEADETVIVVDSTPRGSVFEEANSYIFNNLTTDKTVTPIFSREPNLVSVFDTGYAYLKEGLFAFIQEDAFVFRKGEVNRYFNLIDTGDVDVVGTPMYCYSGQIHPLLYKLFGTNEPYLNTLGYAFWQNFFFSSKVMLDQTDCDFSLKHWKKGEYVDFLGCYMEAGTNLDIMATISFQLRALNTRFKYVAQKLDVSDVNFDIQDVNYWMHVNSLSSIFDLIRNGVPQISISDSNKIEWEKRVSWWEFALESFDPSEARKIPNFAVRYLQVLNTLKTSYNLDVLKINKRKKIIKDLFDL